MIILRDKLFATTGKALELKAAKLMEENKGWTKKDALKFIKERDKAAGELRASRKSNLESAKNSVKLRNLGDSIKKVSDAHKDYNSGKIDHKEYTKILKEANSVLESKTSEIDVGKYNKLNEFELKSQKGYLDSVKNNISRQRKKINAAKYTAAGLAAAGAAYGGYKLYKKHKKNDNTKR